MNLTQRESASIGIYRQNANSTSSLITTVRITAASRRTFKLMEEDSITLVWCESTLYRFKPGDYIVDELFGRFAVAEEQTGQWNKTSGGYDYQLKLVSEYWMWNNYLLMYTQEVTSSVTPGGGGQPIFDGDVIINPCHHAPGTISTNTTRYEARFHLTGQLQDHVGVVLENVKILNLIPTGLPNVSITYKKSAMAERRDEVHYICYDGMHICDALTAIANEYETEWWVTRDGYTVTIHMEKCEGQGNAVALNLDNPNVENEIETYSVSRNQNTYANRIYALGSDWNVPRGYPKLSSSSATTIACKITEFISVSGGEAPMLPDDDGIRPPYEPGDISEATSYYKIRDVNHPISAEMCHMGAVELIVGSSNKGKTSIDTEGYLIVSSSQSAGLNVGASFTVNIYNPADSNKPYGLIDRFIPESWLVTQTDDPSSLLSFGERRLILPSEYPDEWDDGYIIGGYRRWVQKSNLPQQNVVEQMVIFENIYPRCYLRVKNITAKTEFQVEKFADGSVKSWEWVRYTFEAEQYPNGEEFRFNGSYIDGKLQAMFLSDIDERNLCDEINATFVDHNGRLLAGMTFDLGFRMEDKGTPQQAEWHYYYELARNEDYGALLPNDVLKPSEGDVFVLMGWDPKAMNQIDLITAAENALAMAALEYLQAMEEGQFTFQLGMMTQWALGGSQSDYTLPDPGQKYSLPLSIGDGRKVSRLIGYELKLDMPYDSPQLTVGETEAYSRLKRMERRMSGSVSAGYTSKPSSHMPRVIYFRVYTFLSHVSAVGDVPSRVRIVMPLEIELATDEGYAISNVIVRMDGEVVDGAWDAETNTVLVDAVVGDIEIVADAEETAVTTYSVTANLTNITSNAPQSVEEGDSLTVNLTADTGHYIDDSSVVVTMGETDITSTAYNSSTGVISIASVTDAVSIMAAGTAKTYNVSQSLDAHISSNAPSTVTYGSSVSIQLTAAAGYHLSTVSVLMNLVDVTSSAYNSSTGVISIASVTGAIIITASSEQTLPYDAVVEYLQGDGAAYIDTGIDFKEQTITEIKVVVTSIPNSTSILWGAFMDNNPRRPSVQVGVRSEGKWHITSAYSQDMSVSGASHLGNITLNTLYTITVTYAAQPYGTNATAYIFARNSDSGAYLPSNVRIYGLKITRGNTLVRDFIPVRKNGVGYLYDKVSGTLFGNAAASGAFTYGNDVNT